MPLVLLVLPMQLLHVNVWVLAERVLVECAECKSAFGTITPSGPDVGSHHARSRHSDSQCPITDRSPATALPTDTEETQASTTLSQVSLTKYTECLRALIPYLINCESTTIINVT